MHADETDGRFYVGESTLPGAGRGVFAKVPLRAGDRLRVIGVFIDSGSEADRCTAYADEHKLRAGEGRLLIPIGYGGMVNHSPTPNLQKVIERDAVYLQALRDIEPGEELFFTYTEYAQERFGLLGK
jgi:hypothetical protein